MGVAENSTADRLTEKQATFEEGTEGKKRAEDLPWEAPWEESPVFILPPPFPGFTGEGLSFQL